MEQSDKPRLVRVTDPVEIEAVKAGCRGELGCPHGYYYGSVYGWYADAAELEKWRAGRVNEV